VFVKLFYTCMCFLCNSRSKSSLELMLCAIDISTLNKTYLIWFDWFPHLNSEIFRHKTSHMVLSIIFLEDKHKIVLHLSIFYKYQQFFQHRICFWIQPPDYQWDNHVTTHATHSDPWPTLARSTSSFLILLLKYPRFWLGKILLHSSFQNVIITAQRTC
jgi:hypothetical protein